MTPRDEQPPAGGVWKEFDQNILTHSAAHHLMAIDDLVARLGYARVSDVARQLHITRGSVSISLGPLKKAGLVEQDENRHLRLSEEGRALVTAVKTKRLLMERFLTEVLGVPPAQSEIDACKLEHLVSNETARRLVAFLRFIDDEGGAGRELLARWRAAGGECAHVPAQCPSCENDCLAARVADSATARPPVPSAATTPPTREKGTPR
jgi:Mn-dependent DtxR family transcriptional regulator